MNGSARSIALLCVGCACTLAISGYQFGESNHCVYLLDALRESNPNLLANDWYTTQTLQYHVIFTKVSALLMRLHIIQPAFLTLYLLLLMLFHISWRGIVRLLGGEDRAYLLSIILYALCAAGTGLGMYQFFQDSSLLPSNIANVALLFGLWQWLAGAPILAAIGFGAAGLFHLNHAIVGVFLWVILYAGAGRKAWNRRGIIATAIAVLPSVINLAFAAHAKLSRSGAMPLSQFVDLYVRLRHPHHYDPSTWPVGIWLAMIVPTVAGVLLLRGTHRRIVLILVALNLVALVGAGIWYWSETLAQLSLYRFSIYVQLWGCVAAGVWLAKRTVPHIATLWPAGVCGLIIVLGWLRGPYFGLFIPHADSADYLTFCRWVATQTPADALFLVPPDEESMRFIGQRAILVDFKAVPQLSAELSTWNQRLCEVLNLPTLDRLPRGYETTLAAMRARYDALSFDHLNAIAAKYGARYVVTSHVLSDATAPRVEADPPGGYFLYDLGAARSSVNAY